MESTKQEKFSKSIIYLFISQGLIKVLGLVYSLYLINKPNFGDKGNAIYISGYQVFVFMLTFSCIGVPNAVSNYIAQNNNHFMINKIFKSAIITYVFIASINSIILFFVSDFVANKFLGISTVAYNLKLLSPMIIITTLEGIYIGFFNGIKQMKITAKLQFIEQLVKTILTIAFVEIVSKKTSDPNVLSIGATLAVVISIMVSFVLCFEQKKKIQICAKNIIEVDIRYKEIIKNLISFSIPISIGAMLVGITKNSDSFTIMNILAKKIGIQKAQEIYGIIASKVEVLVFLPLAFNLTFSTALIPNISNARKNNDYKTIKFLIENSVYMSTAIGMASFMGLYFFSGDIFNFLFSNSNSGEKLLKIASFSIIFSVLNQTFTGILQGFEKNKITVFSAFLGTIVKIILNIILITRECFYENAIIISSIISNIIMCFITYRGIRKIINFSIKRYFVINFMAGILMIFFSKWLYKILLLFQIQKKLRFLISASFGAILFLLECLLNSYYFGFLKKNKK